MVLRHVCKVNFLVTLYGLSAPFHCSLMQEAADVMEDALKSVKIGMPCVEVISNVTAKPVKYMMASPLFSAHLLNNS